MEDPDSTRLASLAGGDLGKLPEQENLLSTPKSSGKGKGRLESSSSDMSGSTAIAMTSEEETKETEGADGSGTSPESDTGAGADYVPPEREFEDGLPGDLHPRTSREREGPATGVDGTESDRGSEGEKESINEGNFRYAYATDLGSKGLYRAYVNKLASYDRDDTSKESKAPTLVRGLVDYLRTLEERLERLEAKEEKEKEAASFVLNRAPTAENIPEDVMEDIAVDGQADLGEKPSDFHPPEVQREPPPPPPTFKPTEHLPFHTPQKTPQKSSPYGGPYASPPPPPPAHGPYGASPYGQQPPYPPRPYAGPSALNPYGLNPFQTQPSTLQDHNVKPRFYNSSAETCFGFLDKIADESWSVPNTFMSEVDPMNYMRVMYKWNNEPIELGEGEKPNAEDVDILAIRLQSTAVSDFLHKLTDYEFHRNNLIIMAKPYRFLIRNLPALKEHLEVLETRFGSDENADAESTAKDGKPDDDSGEKEIKVEDEGESSRLFRESVERLPPPPVSYETKNALGEFRELVSFATTYLDKDIRLFKDLRAGIPKTVAFENLWMLFDATDTIYCPSKKGDLKMLYNGGPNATEEMSIPSERVDVPQAYRVLATSGGGVLTGQMVPAKPANEIVAQLFRKHDTQSRPQPSSQRTKDRYGPLYVACYYVAFDGERLRTVWDFFAFRPFEGEVDITSLEAYPLNYHTQQNEPLDLLERGRKFIDYAPVTHLNYEGMTVGDDREEISSPIMVDFKQAYQVDRDLIPRTVDANLFWYKKVPPNILEIPKMFCKDASCRLATCWQDEYLGHQIVQARKIMAVINASLDGSEIDGKEEHQLARLKEELEQNNLLVLLPGVVYGFALRNRKWLEFNILNTRPALTVDSESGWNDLVLPEGHRNMVQSMVETHSIDQHPPNAEHSRRSDIGLVQGKGKGCIILLHGAPGVGKTSTAECVAAYTRRPLFPITSGDIGYEPETVEKNLGELFRLGHKWGCVLLIDEADVFLAERDKADVKRNGLVSVFLRVLEYYSGILFLTTNRVGAFDDAFRSRIHLTLYYPRLDEKQSYKVWKMNIKRVSRFNKDLVKDNQPKVKIDKERILKFGEMNYKTLQWNGRQIQNAFQTALALAQFDVRKTRDKSPEITVKHFETIAKASIQFDEYLKEVHVGDEAKTAKMKRLRTDNPSTGDVTRKVHLPASDPDSSESLSDSSDEDADSDDDEEKKRKKRKAKAKKKAKEAAKEAAKEEERAKKKKGKAKRGDDSEDNEKTEKKKSKAKVKKDDSESAFEDSDE